MEDEIRIHIAGMVYNQSVAGTFSLILSEDTGLKRRFTVLIGEAEAQSIVLKLNNVNPPRPLSHDLMITTVRELGARLTKAVIYKIENDIFYSELYFKQAERDVVIDARTSDAVGLAVRTNTPLYIKSDVLNAVGIPMNEADDTRKEMRNISDDELNISKLNKKPYNELSDKQLQSLLDKSVFDERYEDAVVIRDELEKRKKTYQ